MGKGDRKSRKGKIRSGTYGRTRKRKTSSLPMPDRVKDRLRVIKSIDDLLGLRSLLAIREELIREGRVVGTPEELAVESRQIEDMIASMDQEIAGLKTNYVRFTTEELYIHYGRFDKTILVYFEEGSPDFINFGEYVVGQLIYGKGQRKRLNQKIGHKVFDMTDALVPFEARNATNLNDEKLKALREKGFSLSSIKSVNASVFNQNDSYRNGHVSNPIKIEVDWTPLEASQISYHRLKNVVAGNLYPMTESEYHRYLALKMLHDRDRLTEKERYIILNENGQVQQDVRFAFYRAKYELDPLLLTKQDHQDFIKLIEEVRELRMRDIEVELKSAGYQKPDTIIAEFSSTYERLLKVSAQFETEMLSSYGWSRLVCLEPDRFVHILIGHVTSYQIGKLVGKTTFQGGLKEMLRTLKAIVRSQEEPILKALEDGKEFQCVMGTSIYHEGTYYSLHINREGRVLAFHPYEK